MRRFRIEDVTSWSHHRSGWGYASKAIKDHMHSTTGILLVDWADAAFRDNCKFEKKWVGFLHNPITYPSNEYPAKYQSGLSPLNMLVKSDIWNYNLSTCLGIYTLSKHSADFLSPFVKTQSVTHPVKEPKLKFSWDLFQSNPNKQILHIGQWMRRYHSFCQLKTSLRKTLLITGKHWEKDILQMKKYADCSDITVSDPIINKQYDEILCKNVVFLDLYDVAACNTVLECIVRYTPIIINRLPANEEYLGKDYPGFYNSLEEAAELINTKLKEIHEYLKMLDKSHLSVSNFIESIKCGEIYNSLPSLAVKML